MVSGRSLYWSAVIDQLDRRDPGVSKAQSASNRIGLTQKLFKLLQIVSSIIVVHKLWFVLKGGWGVATTIVVNYSSMHSNVIQIYDLASHLIMYGTDC